MAYNNSSTTSIRTVLTALGKRLLAKGQFVPTKFSLGDTCIDYGLYIVNDPPTSTDGILILTMPLPLQTLHSPFYPLFNKTAGTNTTHFIRLKGNTSTSFMLNSLKTYLIVPETPLLVLKYRLVIPNTRYFSNNFSGYTISRYSAAMLGTLFTLTAISDITRITSVYGETTQLTIIGLSSGAQLTLSFTYNASGLPVLTI